MMEKKSLTLIQINDVHGYLKSHLEVVFGAEGFSIAEMGGYEIGRAHV